MTRCDQKGGRQPINCKQGGAVQRQSQARYTTYDNFDTYNIVCELYRELNNGLNRVQIADQWQFCTPRRKTGGSKCASFNQIDAIMDFFGTGMDYTCDMRMINALLYDIWITALSSTVWVEDFKAKNDTGDIDFAFLATRGGLVRFHDNGAAGKAKSARVLGERILSVSSYETLKLDMTSLTLL